MKTSKIKNIQGLGEKNGWFNYEIELEDGTTARKGFKKHPEYLYIGLEVEYEISQERDWAYKTIRTVGFRPKTEEEYKLQKDKTTTGIEVGHAINNAVNMVCAGVELNGIECADTNSKIIAYAEWILKTSDKLKSQR